MAEWTRASEQLPEEGAVVDVRFGGTVRLGVVFEQGRFWQVPGAIDLPAEEWRESPARGKVINVEAADGVKLRGKA